MPRPKRADEKDAIYHALNRGNGRSTIFKKDADYEAFENILAEGLTRSSCRILSYQLMPNHWHFVLQPTVDGGMSDFLRWVSLTHTMRYHAHYKTAGEGHVYQGRFKSFPVQDDDHFLVLCRYVERNAKRAKLVKDAEDWRWGSLYRWSRSSEPLPRLLTPWPIPREANWIRRVNEPLDEKEIDSIRWSIRRGSPLGEPGWVESIARRLDLESTLRPRGRPKKKLPNESRLPRNES
ncbi:Transposase IS200 like protein [Novipirellula aureliae]|uniref:Transposase IS200 like protein n=1 Tax=Novipirellula aureliae TaxID=2527966 RepID=A0A5C6DGU7_9BACT|nr:transposase [Novipirellula aureliae]TWU36503.1 Transposase IS200 like protein [Novipirellula aureliae]